jgi:GNAT superfamily N-acetyltransferase
LSPAELDIRRMEPADLDLALDWAAGEGWNPGRRDALAFWGADSDGLLMGFLDGEPVAAIACARYDDAFGFVGLYLVRPEMRGRGLGLALWRAGHDQLGARTSGLDAVDAQVSNYERSGYRVEGHTYRHQGRGPAGTAAAELAPIDDVPWEELLAMDARAFPAVRESFLRAWTAQPGVRGLALVRGGSLAGYGVIRPCREGNKVGPVFAHDRDGAEAILDGLLAELRPDDPWWIDTPDTNPAAIELARDRGLEPGFRTARMYRGEPPEYERRLVFGVTTLELG